ncbi:MAG: hypothetical protein A2X94_09980 [Bdellovibrionales bacterium GWB1_55_8]|nr:MAG: hypothetical protein A2X94_09980 [Bdellovibrionales bacterium GWB1_55_8]
MALSIGLLLATIAAASVPTAEAAGKKRKSATNAQAPGCPAQSGGSPIRTVVVRDVAGKPFPIPGGTTVDLNADIRSILITTLTSTQSLAPMDANSGGEPENCTSHVELRATVSTLEMNLQEYGLTIGYTPTGTHSALTSATGETKVRVGTLAMDFSLWRCSGSRCSAVAAATANQNTVDTELGFKVNFGLITSGANFVSHPSFNRILRKVVHAGVQQLVQSPRIAELPWSATVREAIPEAGIFTMDAGSQERMTVNQKLVVYSALPAIGACGVFKAIAYARIERVDPVSSLAVIEQTLDSREISEGDVVMLKSE